MRFFQNANYDFMKYRRHWAVVSTLLSLLGLAVFLLPRQLNIGIDFAGGTQVVVKFRDAPPPDELRKGLASVGLGAATIQPYGGPDEFLIRTQGDEETAANSIMQALDRLYNPGQQATLDLNTAGREAIASKLLEADPLQLVAADRAAAVAEYQRIADDILSIRRRDGVIRDWSAVTSLPGVGPDVAKVLQQSAHLGNVGLLNREVVTPTVGSELRQRGILAVVASMIAMLIYIWFRFELRFGVGAIVAIVHDVLVTLGLFALTDFEFNLTTVAAFLTLVGYSVNDSVVVFDRVRETMRKARRTDFQKLINDSVNQTLSRTMLTSVTVFLSSLAMLILGGEVLRGFAFVMTVGVVVGTYSSIFVAASFTLLWEQWMVSRREKQAAAAGRGSSVDAPKVAARSAAAPRPNGGGKSTQGPEGGEKAAGKGGRAVAGQRRR